MCVMCAVFQTLYRAGMRLSLLVFIWSWGAPLSVARKISPKITKTLKPLCFVAFQNICTIKIFSSNTSIINIMSDGSHKSHTKYMPRLTFCCRLPKRWHRHQAGAWRATTSLHAADPNPGSPARDWRAVVTTSNQWPSDARAQQHPLPDAYITCRAPATAHQYRARLRTRSDVGTTADATGLHRQNIRTTVTLLPQRASTGSQR